MTVKRTSQVAVETVSAPDPALVASQVVVEIVSASNLTQRVSQVVVELVSENVPDDVVGTGQTSHQLIIGM